MQHDNVISGAAEIQFRLLDHLRRRQSFDEVFRYLFTMQLYASLENISMQCRKRNGLGDKNFQSGSVTTMRFPAVMGLN